MTDRTASTIVSDTDPEIPVEAEDEPEAEPEEQTELAEQTEETDADVDSAVESGPGPGNDLDDQQLLERATALLFASPDPVGLARLVALLERPETARVRQALATLEERLASAGLPLVLREVAGGWRLMTAPEQAETVARLVQSRKVERITPAALETLSIVAYRQPVTKAEIEAIRGVQSGPILRSLTDRGLVRVTGRADQPGSPLQYGTTREFLDRFGLGSLKDLPRDGELARD